MLLVLIFCSLFIVNSSFAVSTTRTVPKCTFQNDRISVQNITGTIPFGITKPVNIPYGTRCTFWFDVPTGYALRIETTARGTYEQISFNNRTINLPVQNEVEYSVDKEVSYLFYSWSSNYSFFASWSYVDLSFYTQKVVTTGNYFNLQLPPLTYYTVQAAKNDQVHFTFSDLYSYNVPYVNDVAQEQLFVYDGPDILKSQYLGRANRVYFGNNVTLSGTSKFHSTGSTLTFLNLYGQRSPTYLMTNDWSKLDPHADYMTFTVSSQYGGRSIMQNPFPNQDTYYTMICPDCYYNQMFITKLDFYTYPNVTNRYVELQGLTPTHQMPYLIRYEYSDDTSGNFPQLIYSNVITFHTHLTDLYYTLDYSYGDWPFYNNWLNVSEGSKRKIISPHLWNPSNPIASIDKIVSNDGDSLAYTLVIDDFEKNGGDNSTYLRVTASAKTSPTTYNYVLDQKFDSSVKSQTINATCFRMEIKLTDPTNTSTIVAHLEVRKADIHSGGTGFNLLCILMTVIGYSL